MAKALMIQGTGSGAGKSLIVAALCRIWSDAGINVAPFKAQNMALNSYITKDGGEIGRAQALQAEAARVAPTVDMNPILLKTSGDMGSQVIIHGKVHSTMPAQEYYRFKETAWQAVKESYARLAARHDLVILEGAGSPAEINLREVDIVNMAMAQEAKAPVLLVGDIDKGGVFAALYGTMKLLGRDSRYLKGFIINKFRGDREILEPGLPLIQKKTGRPVVGVLPYIKNIGLPEEDGLALSSVTQVTQRRREAAIRVVVLRLPYLSNFTDFDPLGCEPDLELIYSTHHADVVNADVVIIPGTKKTVADLNYLRQNQLDKSINEAGRRGGVIIGICGGFQIMGKKIYDPHGVESNEKEAAGLGLLPVEATFERVKTTCQVEGRLGEPARLGLDADCEITIKGYEIHLGVSSGELGLFTIRRLNAATTDHLPDGAANGNCWGTYVHGLFENDDFRRGIINQIRKKKGLSPIVNGLKYRDLKEQALDNLAAVVRENLDMRFVERLIGR